MRRIVLVVCSILLIGSCEPLDDNDPVSMRPAISAAIEHDQGLERAQIDSIVKWSTMPLRDTWFVKHHPGLKPPVIRYQLVREAAPGIFASPPFTDDMARELIRMDRYHGRSTIPEPASSAHR